MSRFHDRSSSPSFSPGSEPLARAPRLLSCWSKLAIPYVLASMALAMFAAPLVAQPGAGGKRGITLYADANFRGASQTYYYDTPTLQGGYFGQDRASSVRVDPGCEVTLYRDVDYRGRSATIYEDVADLGNTRVGNDAVSSLRVVCGHGGRPGHGGPGYGGPGYGGPGQGGGPGRGGVTLFAGPGFRGRNETFYGNEGVLDNNPIGLGTRSLRIAEGCRVTVYEHSDYRGRSYTFENDVEDLAYTRYGARQVSSIQLQCRQSAGPGYPSGGSGARGVSLYRDEDYRGRTQHFSDHVADLSRTQVGNDAASSIRISRGCRAVLYSDTDFRGRSTVIDRDSPSLKGTAVGNDRVSSLTVECSGRY